MELSRRAMKKFVEVQTELNALQGGVMSSVTTIGVKSLFSPDILVEIEVVVRVP